MVVGDMFGVAMMLVPLTFVGFGIYFFVTLLLLIKKRNEVLMSIRNELRKSNEAEANRYSMENEKVTEGY